MRTKEKKNVVDIVVDIVNEIEVDIVNKIEIDIMINILINIIEIVKDILVKDNTKRKKMMMIVWLCSWGLLVHLYGK